MPTTGLIVQIERVERLEEEATHLKRAIGLALRSERETAGLSLRDVGPRVGLTAAGISLIELGKAKRTTTLRRLVEFYDSWW